MWSSDPSALFFGWMLLNEWAKRINHPSGFDLCSLTGKNQQMCRGWKRIMGREQSKLAKEWQTTDQQQQKEKHRDVLFMRGGGGWGRVYSLFRRCKRMDDRSIRRAESVQGQRKRQTWKKSRKERERKMIQQSINQPRAMNSGSCSCSSWHQRMMLINGKRRMGGKGKEEPNKLYTLSSEHNEKQRREPTGSVAGVCRRFKVH